MLPDIGGLEILVIAVVALIVVGPKDLPLLLRKLGQFMAKLRGMAAEFRSSFDEMARQSELDDLRKEVEALRQGHIADYASEDSSLKISQEVADIERSLADVGVSFQPPMGAQHAEFMAQQEAETATAKPARKPRAKAAAAKAPAKKAVAKTAAKPQAKSAVKTAAAKPRAKKPAGAKA